MKKIFNILTYACIGVCVLFFILMIIGFRFRIVLTGSMSDVYNVGSIVVTKKIDFEKLSIDDDISFIYDGKVITHRITKIDYENEIVNTKGTQNIKEEEGINKDDILGKVFFTIPKIGSFIYFIKHNILLILMTISSIFLLVYGIKSFKKAKN